MLKRWIEILANMIFWISTAWLLASSFSIVAMERTIENGIESQVIQRDSMLVIIIIGVVLFSAILFYFNLFIITRSHGASSYLKTGLYSLTAFSITILLFYIVVSTEIASGLPPVPQSLIIGIFTFYYAVSVAYGFGISWLKSEADRKNLIIERNSAELSLLRNQLQPHFLFNSLNNLVSMINQKQYGDSVQSIEKLAQLLRYVIEETRSEKVSLSQEIRFIENFTSLQMLRFDPSEVDLSISVCGNPSEFKVEPGLFLPFIENAFKYGTEPEVKSQIKIHFDLTQDNLIYFSVTNPILDKNVSHRMGTGIETTRNRLKLVYADQFQLDIKENQKFEVHLKINCA